MNILDIGMLSIIGICVLFGLYRGFISSLLGVISVFAAMFIAYSLAPTLSREILKNQSIVGLLSQYTDAASRLGDVTLSTRPVVGLDTSTIANIVSRINLPAPFGALLNTNLTQQVYNTIGSISVSDYINQTLVTSVVSVLSYIITFLVSYFALSLISGMFAYMFHFPVLKQLDTLLGGVLGLVRGVFFAFVLFALVPVFMMVLPFDGLTDLVNTSQIGRALYQSNIITTILSGRLF